LRIDLIVGARPNFMKAAPLYHELCKYPEDFQVRLVHTGQHYDKKMSQIFFEQLRLPKPAVYLGVGSGSHGEQTAKVMIEYEKLLMEQTPAELVLVVGDVNSTMACALVTKKLHLRLGHIEAGLRSRDMSMPEEINRLVTDSISDLLFTTSRDADENLISEGHPEERIHFVGNLMIDSLQQYLDQADCSQLLQNLGVSSGRYGLITLHRPSNVDDEKMLLEILNAFERIQQDLPLIFPVHPRTEDRINRLRSSGAIPSLGKLYLIPPVGYLEFIALEREAKLILTDSGGIQEESTVLGIPCLTLRENTERPVTIWEGTNQLVELSTEAIVKAVSGIMNGEVTPGGIPDKWDGKSAQRIADILRRINQGKPAARTQVNL